MEVLIQKLARPKMNGFDFQKVLAEVVLEDHAAMITERLWRMMVCELARKGYVPIPERILTANEKTKMIPEEIKDEDL